MSKDGSETAERDEHTVTWFFHAVFIVTCVALVSAVAGIVLLFVKRWALARLVAKRATLTAVVALCVAVAELQVAEIGRS